MDKALKIALSKPNILAKNPNIVQQVLESPEFKIIQKLVETGDLHSLKDTPLDGITINFDKVDVVKNYPTQNEYGHLLHDVMIPGNAPVSQILHNQKDSRVLVPYANMFDNEETRLVHLDRIKNAMLEVCNDLGHPIQLGNIITNEDAKGHTILQIANKHVNNLEDNKKFTELVKSYIKKTYQDDNLCGAILVGYETFKYNEFHQKYPLLAEVPANNYGVLQKLIHDPCAQPIIINVNQYIHNNNNNITDNHGIINTGNGNQSMTQNITVMSFDDAVKEFIQSIKSQKPAWYKEGSWMHINAIRKYFDAQCNDQFIGRGRDTFNKIIKKNVGKMSARKLMNGHNQVAVFLKKYNDL